jgi:hypothetical protein
VQGIADRCRDAPAAGSCVSIWRNRRRLISRTWCAEFCTQFGQRATRLLHCDKACDGLRSPSQKLYGMSEWRLWQVISHIYQNAFGSNVQHSHFSGNVAGVGDFKVRGM